MTNVDGVVLQTIGLNDRGNRDFVLLRDRGQRVPRLDPIFYIHSGGRGDDRWVGVWNGAVLKILSQKQDSYAIRILHGLAVNFRFQPFSGHHGFIHHHIIQKFMLMKMTCCMLFQPLLFLEKDSVLI